MCGIAGLVSFSDRLEPALLDQLGQSMLHRGPDSGGALLELHAKVEIALVSRRLKIIDLSPGGDQPMHDRAGELTIVYNGEVYNHAELQSELVAAGFEYRSRSDTE